MQLRDLAVIDRTPFNNNNMLYSKNISGMTMILDRAIALQHNAWLK